MKIKIRALFFATLTIGVALPFFSGVARAEDSQDIQQFQILADVNIQDAKIVKQEGNNLDISFSLTNGQGAQPDIRYGVSLINYDAGETVFQKIFDDKITLAPDSSIGKEVSFSVPEYVSGSYDIWLHAESGEGMPLSSVVVGKVNFNASSTHFINILDSSCKLFIKGLPDNYSLEQGVDVAEKEDLFLSCDAQNTSSENITAQVDKQTFRRSLYGDKVNVASGAAQILTFAPGEKKNITIGIEKPNVPQSYDTLVTLLENGKSVSNSIDVHYVIQGSSASISNLQLDKDSYLKGDKLAASFVWSFDADSFPGSRSGKKVGSVAYGNLSVKDNGKDCIEPITHQAIDRSYALSKISAEIIADCPNPSAQLSIEDENGKILVQKDYDFTPTEAPDKNRIGNGTAENGPKSSDAKRIIVAVVILATLVALGSILFYFKKRRPIGIFILVLLGGAFFFTHQAGATTIGANWPCAGCAPRDAYCDFTVSPGSTSPGGAVTVYTSNCRTDACTNKFWVDAYVNGGKVPSYYVGGMFGDYNYSPVNVYAPMSCGTQAIPVRVVLMNVNIGEYAEADGNLYYSTIGCAPCALPWGGTIASGSSVTAYASSVVPNGSSCSSQVRVCNSGFLSGTYAYPSCSVTPAIKSFSANPLSVNTGGATTLSWSTNGASSCYASSTDPTQFNGWVAVNGSSTVPVNVTTTYNLECWNWAGVSSGKNSVTVAAGKPCNLPWGGTIGNGQSVTAYKYVAAPSGTLCTAAGNFENRTCNDGTLSGSFTNPSCQNPPDISSFTATPSTLSSAGGNSTLTWSVSGASSCWAQSPLDWQGWKNPAGGSQVVSISGSTSTVINTFDLECWNSSNVSSGKETVSVKVQCSETCTASTCSGNSVQVCSDANGDGCKENSGLLDCGVDTCVNGTCLCTPTADCAQYTCLNQQCDYCDGSGKYVTTTGTKDCLNKSWKEELP